MERENAWKKCDEARIKEVFDFCEGYRRYISECKTERECAARSIEMAKEKGYENLFDVISEEIKCTPAIWEKPLFFLISENSRFLME